MIKAALSRSGWWRVVPVSPSWWVAGWASASAAAMV
jgi:hypothetical protein